MGEKKIICVEYRGKRFPRTVSLRTGGKISFQRDRTILELEEYDALMVLRGNTRLNPDKFEFTVADTIAPEAEEEQEEALDDADEKNEADDQRGSEAKPRKRVRITRRRK